MNQDFEIKDGVVIKYHGSDKDVIIPDGVTAIGKKVFYKYYNLHSVKIPDSVTSIGEMAFRHCLELTSVTLPHGITKIEGYTFKYCINLKSVEIPDNVTSIGSHAFACCTGLTSVRLPAGIKVIEAEAFIGCTRLKHAPLILVGEQMLYQPKNTVYLNFPEIKNIVLNHDYALTQRDYELKIRIDVKYHLIFQMFTLGIDQKGTSAYITQHISEMFPALIRQEDLELIRKILDSGRFVTEENIDDFIQYAIETQKYEIQLRKSI